MAFPIAAFVSYFGQHCTKLLQQPYATSTFAYMLGLAIMKLDGRAGAQIQVYGVPLLTDEEYAYQRENATFFAGFAMGRGIRFELTPNAAWLEADGLYGYANPDTIELVTRLKAMAAVDAAEYDRQYAEIQRDNELLKARAATVDGARQYAHKIQKRLTVILRGGKI